MNSLISVRANFLYGKQAKKKEGEQDKYKRFTEIILLCDKPSYEVTNERDIVRKRGVEELRFIVSEKSLDVLINSLKHFKEMKDEELIQE